MEKRYDWSKLTKGWWLDTKAYKGSMVRKGDTSITPGAYYSLHKGRIGVSGTNFDEMRMQLDELEAQLKQCEVPKTPLLHPGELVEYRTMADCWVNAVVVGADLIRTSEGIKVKIYVPGSDTVRAVYAEYLRPRSR